MKRYRLQFRTTEEPADPGLLRQAVEDVLLRLHPKYSYRMGRIDPRGPSLEIESEADKKTLAEALRPVERKMPVVLDTVGWGWEEEEGRPLPDAAPGPLDRDRDPLARVEPLAGPAVFLPVNQRVVYRFVLFAVLTLALILSFPIRYLMERILILELAWAGFYAVWLYSLKDVPFDLRLLLEKIDCAADGLELAFRFPKRTVRLPWESIRELETRFSSCTIRAEGKPVRFLLDRIGGFREKDIILKTILHRASLRFVESNLLRSVYRRSDAP
jgi:hypothetical protein